MLKKNHKNFILSPITKILEDVVSANSGIGNGIETYPLYDYIMQSTFLKMTGFQEQKMKCICWEVATNDYEYRYKRYTQKPLGECSTYEDKKTVYKDLIQQIENYFPEFDLSIYLDNSNIKNEIYLKIKNIFINTNLSTWDERGFVEFLQNKNLINHKHFGTNNNLFENVLQDKYTMLYNHRNKCAHNTLSYQQNLPTLDVLVKESYKYENYFIRFSLLILIDEIIVKLYIKYLEIFDDIE